MGGKTGNGVKTLRWNSAGGTRVSCGLGGTGGSVRWGRDLGAQIDQGTWRPWHWLSQPQTVKLPE